MTTNINDFDSSSTSSLETKNPAYADRLDDWRTCRDCKKGERHIKAKRTLYLPATGGMYEDGFGSEDVRAKGNVDYNCYLERAVFHSNLERAVDTYLGRLWHKDPKIELPPQMEPLREDCTRRHDSMLQLLQDMQEELLTTGRLGLLADLPQGVTYTGLPFVSMYSPENIINWDEGEDYQVATNSLNLVVLDESGDRRNSTFSWEYVKQFRVLMLGDPDTNEEDGTANYRAGLFVANDIYTATEMIEPSFHQNKLTEIPFVFVNSKDLDPNPEEPPQLALARKDLTIYRGEADYRQCLAFQAQPTLFTAGVDENAPDERIRLGVGAHIKSTNPNAKAEFIGVDPVGVPEMRTAIENDQREAEILSGQLTDNKSNAVESGDAMGKRMAGMAASLTSISSTSCIGLQTLLRMIARWIGADPELVIVTPNLEFGDKQLTAADILALQNAKNGGAPISEETMHDNLSQAGLTSKDYEAEKNILDNEEPRLPLVMAQASNQTELKKTVPGVPPEKKAAPPGTVTPKAKAKPKK